VIGQLIERAGRRASLADAVLKTDETTVLSFEAGRVLRASTATSQGVNLRLIADGRAGTAGAVDDDPEALLERAMASALAGEPTVLTLPARASLPAVVTHIPRAAAATIPELLTIGQLLRDRLGTDRADLEVAIERSLGSVRVANTRGVDAGYDVSSVRLLVRASRVRNGRRLMVESRLATADLPALSELEQTVAMIRQRLAWAEREAAPPAASGRQRVIFLPSALSVLLQPVEQALTGKAALLGDSPLARQRGTRAVSALLTIRDDPLVDGRPGSRPIDDEGTVSRPLVLVRAGEIEALLYDLEGAGRAGATPTGHGRRSVFGKPQAAWSNLVVEAGTSSWEELLGTVGDGLVLERLGDFPGPKLAGGAFALPVQLAWRVQGGEVVGLVPEMTLAGNAHDLLGRVIAVGRDVLWVGSRAAPAVAVEGVSVF
jgi:PmbA protein